MTELSDYKRMVEKPMLARYDSDIKKLVAEVAALRASRDAILDEAIEAVQSVRHKIAATFTPECSGQRGEDKTNVLYDAQVAIRALKGIPQQSESEVKP